MTFRTALAALRTKRGLSQSQLAELAEYDASLVQRMESGTRNPSRTAVISLGIALGLTPKIIDALLILAGYVPQRPGFTRPAEQAIRQALTT